MILKKRSCLSALFLSLLIAGGCHRVQDQLGTEKNPIKFQLVPSVDVKVLEDNSKKIQDYLEAHTPYKYKITVPQSYIAVVESFGTKRADVAALNTYGYYLAHEKYQAEAKLTVIRFGMATYQSQFIARADSNIKSLKDLQGKKIAFVDPASASGYLLPMKTLKDRKITPGQTVFAMKHDSVVSMIYQHQVDAGATYYTPAQNGEIQDARRMVKTEYPDVEKKVKIIELSDPIPNDPIVFRKDMPDDMKENIVNALISYINTDEGKKTFDLTLGATNFKKATDQDYDVIREMMSSLKEK
jgi:phosphonate transport system substrate-binding protein